jgi:hypothetical protein
MSQSTVFSGKGVDLALAASSSIAVALCAIATSARKEKKV